MNNLKLIIVISFLLISKTSIANVHQQAMEAIFSQEKNVLMILKMESALARAQATVGDIPQWAADEISSKALLKYAPLEAIKNEHEIVKHRMVALLNVWRRSLGKAGEYIHFGATTVDIYDTLMTLQLIESSELIIKSLRAIEMDLITMATKHKATVMIGRTLGQQALPITFGKKVSGYLAENRRHIERMKSLKQTLTQFSILKGAVGSYVGLGENAMKVEALFARELGLRKPVVDDWHSGRDVYGQFAQTLALIAQTYGRLGQEIYLLQMNEIGEVYEQRKASAVGSSTMPHKINPSASDALIFFARLMNNHSQVVVMDTINFFERDHTSRTNNAMTELNVEFAKMLDQADRLIKSIRINEDKMQENLNLSQGLILSQRVAFFLADKIGKATANEKLNKVVKYAHTKNISLYDALMKDEDLKIYFTVKDLTELLNPNTYVGLAVQQTDAVIKKINEYRNQE